MSKKQEFVFIITKGDYSEYSIITVFDDEDKARKYVREYNKGTYFMNKARVEVYPFNKKDCTTTEIYSVKINRFGEVIEKVKGTRTFKKNDLSWEKSYWNKDDKSSIKYIWGNSVRSYDVALKAARDTLNFMEAVEEGLT